MSRVFKLVILIFVMCVCTACSIGSYSVTFLDYKGNKVSEKLYSVSESVTMKNSPYLSTREGFTHTGWKDVEHPEILALYTTKRVMMPTYSINVNDGCFNALNRKFEWNGWSLSQELTVDANQTRPILIRDMSTSSNFSSVSILSKDSNVSITEFVIYDKNGNVCENSSAEWCVWQPKTFETMGTYDFIIEIKTDAEGIVVISVA